MVCLRLEGSIVEILIYWPLVLIYNIEYFRHTLQMSCEACIFCTNIGET